MMSAVLYTLIIKPISLLPYRALYVLSDFFYLVFYHLVGYRKKVVRGNLTRSFPESQMLRYALLRWPFTVISVI